MSYRPDPGGVFASDTHRRVLAHLPVPSDEHTELHPLGHRISADAHHELETVDDLEAVLAELAEEEYATLTKAGWRMTKGGFDALQAPVPEAEPGTPVKPALLGGLEVS